LLVLPLYFIALPTPILPIAQGAVACLLSFLLTLPVWWRLINLLFFPLVWLVTQADLHPAWFMAGFLALALTSLGSLRHRIPLYLSSQAAVAALLRRLPKRKGLRVVDLGCGLGGMLAGLAEERDDIHLRGVEMAPFNWLASRWRLRGRAEVRLADLWAEDLSRYDVVYAYLSPAPMRRLWEKVEREMRPGSLFVSNTFAVPGVDPDEIVELRDFTHSRLLIWRR
jgi:SAM-dependent methyltransferase